MSIDLLLEDCRTYLKSHPMNQEALALAIGVSHSWLNKFINGQFPNMRLGRWQRLHAWVAADRIARGLAQPEKRSA
jgi:transcriptional regulator with XRE-family HTH domain